MTLEFIFQENLKESKHAPDILLGVGLFLVSRGSSEEVGEFPYLVLCLVFNVNVDVQWWMETCKDQQGGWFYCHEVSC